MGIDWLDISKRHHLIVLKSSCRSNVECRSSSSRQINWDHRDGFPYYRQTLPHEYFITSLYVAGAIDVSSGFGLQGQIPVGAKIYPAMK